MTVQFTWPPLVDRDVGLRLLRRGLLRPLSFKFQAERSRRSNVVADPHAFSSWPRQCSRTD